jgi:hypothetical protein
VSVGLGLYLCNSTECQFLCISFLQCLIDLQCLISKLVHALHSSSVLSCCKLFFCLLCFFACTDCFLAWFWCCSTACRLQSSVYGWFSAECKCPDVCRWAHSHIVWALCQCRPCCIVLLQSTCGLLQQQDTGALNRAVQGTRVQQHNSTACR